MSHLCFPLLGRRSGAMIVAAALLGLTGCGPNLYPVHGKVVWENGADARELARGLVVGEATSGGGGVRGDIEEDGSFTLSTLRPGDGVLPGKYRVAVVEYRPGEPPAPPTMDLVFSKLDTSKLEINVQPKTPEVILKVRRAPPKARR